jgi:hypothetical protein
VCSYLVPEDCISDWAIETSKKTHSAILNVLVNILDLDLRADGRLYLYTWLATVWLQTDE